MVIIIGHGLLITKEQDLVVHSGGILVIPEKKKQMYRGATPES